MLVIAKHILDKAHRGNYAIGHFNVNNMEIVQAVVAAAEKQKAPVIMATSQGAIKYAGMNYLFPLMKSAAEHANVPIAIHLDHGTDLDVVKQCIRVGYTSVMFDGSHHSFEKNIRLTKKVVALAHDKGVTVEGELGTIGGTEDLVSAREIIYTDPDKAVEFVERTGIDSLAIAIGTSHGAYKFAGKARLDLDRLKEIKKQLPMPLVLHGASEVPARFVRIAKKYGANLKGVHGVPDSQLKKAIKHGINKVNTDTDIRIAFDAGIRKFLKQKPKDFDPRHILGEARACMQDIIEHRIKDFGSKGKAK